ncbi:MAG: ATP-binding cassette domain-containing protein [Sphingobacterium sp.]|nr:ATP-binding cassette domain-containing protein [Sphingobacterium sp.]
MSGVGRVHPPNRQVLKDISLGFYFGAKIGVLGLNGSGKSTLLGIIAGQDKGYIGEVALSKGYSVGLLEQDPQLDPAKTVIEIVREGVQPIVDHPGPLRRGLRQDGRPRGRHGRPARRAGPAPGGDRQARRLEPRQPPRDRHGGPALPALRRRPSRCSRAASGAASP